MADSRRIKLSSIMKQKVRSCWYHRRPIDWVADEFQLRIATVRLYYAMLDQKFYDLNGCWPWDVED